MGTIFKMAKRVLIWLGEDAEGKSEEAVDSYILWHYGSTNMPCPWRLDIWGVILTLTL
jgi:hypothetical protein